MQATLGRANAAPGEGKLRKVNLKWPFYAVLDIVYVVAPGMSYSYHRDVTEQHFKIYTITLEIFFDSWLSQSSKGTIKKVRENA